MVALRNVRAAWHRPHRLDGSIGLMEISMGSIGFAYFGGMKVLHVFFVLVFEHCRD
jgi:hypothetical protein